jgi:hypothetical protein
MGVCFHWAGSNKLSAVVITLMVIVIAGEVGIFNLQAISEASSLSLKQPIFKMGKLRV